MVFINHLVCSLLIYGIKVDLLLPLSELLLQLMKTLQKLYKQRLNLAFGAYYHLVIN